MQSDEPRMNEFLDQSSLVLEPVTRVFVRGLGPECPWERFENGRKASVLLEDGVVAERL